MPARSRVRMGRLVGGIVAPALLAGTACTAAGGQERGDEAAGRSASTPNATAPNATAPAAAPPSTPQPTGGPDATASPSATATASAAPVVRELPRGGRSLFPEYRLVGYAGAPLSPALGRLGIGNLDERGRELERRARPYAAGRQILPVFELIATVAHARPGKDGQYRGRASDATIAEYLRAARRARALLLLNIQPGRADFLPETKAYERWLREPDVSVALDPEWAVERGQVPGRSYGRTTGKELDEVAAYLAGLVKTHRLPEKVMVFHQVAPSIVRQERRLRHHPGVEIVKSVDGIGSPGAKVATWRRLTTGMPGYFRGGFKLFYEEDRRSGPLMTPAQVLALRPQPDYVMYE